MFVTACGMLYHDGGGYCGMHPLTIKPHDVVGDESATRGKKIKPRELAWPDATQREGAAIRQSGGANQRYDWA